RALVQPRASLRARWEERPWPSSIPSRRRSGEAAAPLSGPPRGGSLFPPPGEGRNEPMPRRPLAAGLACLAAACGSSREKPEVQVEAAVLSGARGAPIEIMTSRELEEVARLEDTRSLGNGRLLELLANDRDVRVRVSAATALGRFPFPQFGAEVTVALVRALEDPELDVRLAAAFALGVRADPDCAGTLLAYRNDPEPRMRARLVEAASKLADPGIHAQLILSLRDADLSVRMEAAVG